MSDLASSIKHHRNPYIPLLSMVFALGLIIYSPYLFGDQLYIYNDIGSDTLTSFVPAYQSAMRTLSSGKLPFWSFAHGLGANTFPLTTSQVYDPFNALLYLFGENLIYALPCIQILKIMCTAAMACALLRKLGHSYHTCLILPLFYAFNADVIVRGGWYHHAIDTFIICLMFYGVECIIQDRNYVVLPLAGLYLVISRGMNYPYIYSIFLVGYCLVRLIYRSTFQISDIVRSLVKTIGLFLIGIGMGCFFYIPCLKLVFASSRTSGLRVNLFSDLLSFTELKAIFTAFLTLFSPVMMGTGSDYSGWVNILEDPILYCGILVVYLIFFAFTGKTSKQKKTLIFLLVLCVLYIIWPMMHRIFNGPTAMTYKTSSFMIQNVLLYVAAYGADNFFNMLDKKSHERVQGKKLLKKVLFYNIPTALFIIAVIIAILVYDEIVKLYAFIAALAFIFLYQVIILFAGDDPLCHISKSKPIGKQRVVSLLFVAICVEVCLFSYGAVNFARQTVPKSAVKNGEYYWDGTIEAVNFVDSLHHTPSFYRFQKTYDSFRTCDYSQYQGYHGVYLYSSFVHQSILDFYGSFDQSAIGNHAVIIPSYRNFPLNSLLSVRYILDKGDISAETVAENHLELVGTIEGINIYENSNSLPFGIHYTEYVDPSEISDQSEGQKVSWLYHAFIPDDTMNLASYQKANITQLRLEHLSAYGVSTEKNQRELILNVDDVNPWISFSVEGDIHSKNIAVFLIIRSDVQEEASLYWAGSDMEFDDSHCTKFSIREGENEYRIPITADRQISQIRMDLNGKPGQSYSMMNYQIEDLRRTNDDSVKQQIESHKNHHMELIDFSDTLIIGRSSVDEPTLLLLSIPFAEGWTATVNGESRPIYCVSNGLSGIELLEKGDYQIELRYVPPGLYLGMAVSAVSLILYLIICFFQQNRPH